MTYEEFLNTFPALRTEDKEYESDKAKVYDIIYQYLDLWVMFQNIT
ncbi:MAG: hypothetical protein RI955_1900 [Bacteroidota bacterium]|jgi:hypothetical protein